MSLRVEFKVRGGHHMARLLAQLPRELHKKTLRRVVRAAAKKIQEKAIDLAPVGSGYNVYGWKGDILRHRGGNLRRSISITFRKQKGQLPESQAVIAHVRTRGGEQWQDNAAYYSHIVEFGGRHMPKHPFMLPASKSSRRAAYVAAEMKARREWRRVMRKLGAIGKRDYVNLKSFVK